MFTRRCVQFSRMCILALFAALLAAPNILWYCGKFLCYRIFWFIYFQFIEPSHYKGEHRTIDVHSESHMCGELTISCCYGVCNGLFSMMKAIFGHSFWKISKVLRYFSYWLLKACARHKVTGHGFWMSTRGSDQLESLISFGHWAHSTFDVLCNSINFSTRPGSEFDTKCGAS